MKLLFSQLRIDNTKFIFMGSDIPDFQEQVDAAKKTVIGSNGKSHTETKINQTIDEIARRLKRLPDEGSKKTNFLQELQNLDMELEKTQETYDQNEKKINKLKEKYLGITGEQFKERFDVFVDDVDFKHDWKNDSNYRQDQVRFRLLKKSAGDLPDGVEKNSLQANQYFAELQTVFEEMMDKADEGFWDSVDRMELNNIIRDFEKEKEELQKKYFSPKEVKPEPVVEVEPVKAEPVKAEPVKAEPVKVEPVKAEPVKVEPVKVKPVKVEPVKVEPVKVEPVTPEPVVEVESNKHNTVRDQIAQSLINKIEEDENFDFTKEKYTVEDGDNLSRIAFGFDKAATAKWKGEEENVGKEIDHSKKDININWNTKVILSDGTNTTFETTLTNAKLIHPGDIVSFTKTNGETVIHIEKIRELSQKPKVNKLDLKKELKLEQRKEKMKQINKKKLEVKQKAEIEKIEEKYNLEHIEEDVYISNSENVEDIAAIAERAKVASAVVLKEAKKAIVNGAGLDSPNLSGRKVAKELGIKDIRSTSLEQQLGKVTGEIELDLDEIMGGTNNFYEGINVTGIRLTNARYINTKELGADLLKNGFIVDVQVPGEEKTMIRIGGDQLQKSGGNEFVKQLQAGKENEAAFQKLLVQNLPFVQSELAFKNIQTIKKEGGFDEYKKINSFVKDFLVQACGFDGDMEDIIGDEVEKEKFKIYGNKVQFGLDWEGVDYGSGENDAFVTITKVEGGMPKVTVQSYGVGIDANDLDNLLKRDLTREFQLKEVKEMLAFGKNRGNKRTLDGNIATGLQEARASHRAWKRLEKAISKQERAKDLDGQQ